MLSNVLLLAPEHNLMICGNSVIATGVMACFMLFMTVKGMVRTLIRRIIVLAHNFYFLAVPYNLVLFDSSFHDFQ